VLEMIRFFIPPLGWLYGKAQSYFFVAVAHHPDWRPDPPARIRLASWAYWASSVGRGAAWACRCPQAEDGGPDWGNPHLGHKKSAQASPGFAWQAVGATGPGVPSSISVGALLTAWLAARDERDEQSARTGHPADIEAYGKDARESSEWCFEKHFRGGSGLAD